MREQLDVSREGPKRAMLAEFAAVARALGSPHRLDILEHLAQAERSVEILAQRTGLPFANVSQHLQSLRRAGLVVARREGKHIVYRIADEGVLHLLATLRAVAERQVAEVRKIVDGYFHERDSMEPVSFAELLERAESGLVTVLDVRPEDEFAQGHLPGAVNIPLSQLAGRLRDLPEQSEVVAYCRGPWCVLAFEAVALLRKEGRAARRLDGGLPEWKLAGLPVRQGAI
jgi:ArsR family transcriptional regulator